MALRSAGRRTRALASPHRVSPGERRRAPDASREHAADSVLDRRGRAERVDHAALRSSPHRTHTQVAHGNQRRSAGRAGDHARPRVVRSASRRSRRTDQASTVGAGVLVVRVLERHGERASSCGTRGPHRAAQPHRPRRLARRDAKRARPRDDARADVALRSPQGLQARSQLQRGVLRERLRHQIELVSRRPRARRRSAAHGIGRRVQHRRDQIAR